MKITKFEDIIAWQKAGKLTVDIYKIFEKSANYNFKNQIERCVLSIMNNIKFNKLLSQTIEISKMLSGLIKTL